MASPGHGQPPRESFPMDTWLSDDPDMALVHADMEAWDLAHPCDCPALCECGEQDDG